MLLIGSGASAKALGVALDCTRVREHRFITVGERNRTGNTVVMWGRQWPGLGIPARLLNGEPIFDKCSQLRKMAYAGVQVPRMVSREGLVFYEAANLGPDPWLARLRYHRGGSDILGPMDFLRLREVLRSGQRDYGVQLIDKKYEWRVHVFQDRILRIAQKKPTPGCVPGVVWNAGQGYHFSYEPGLTPKTREELCTLATNAVQALRMDFGAVDIIQDKERRKYVLEVNSAPGIADNANTLQAYVEAIRVWANE